MHWKVHYKSMSRIRNGSHMSNTTRVISVQSRFPTLIQCLKILGVVLNWKDDFFLSVYSSFEKQAQLVFSLTFNCFLPCYHEF